MKILFVCTGNTCRGPMAEVIAKRASKEKNKDLSIESAGIYAFKGSGASENSAAVINEMGLDLSGHVATPLDEKLIKENDLILTMTKSQKEALINACEKYSEKIYTLKEYVGEEGEVTDPFGGDINVYKSCAEEIESLVNKLIDKI